MKKSFMTRILATGLSFAMAFSMAAVTSVTPASAATKPVLVDAVTGGSGRAVTVNVGEVAKLKIDATTGKTYAVSSVKKSSKKIKTSVSKTGTVVYVRGVAETGEKDSAIRVSFKVKKNGKTSKSTFASKIKVVSPKPAVAELTEAVQKETKKVAVKFSTAVESVKAADVTIKRVDGNVVIPVKSVSLDTDKTGATIETYTDMKDGKEYKVTYTATDEAKTVSEKNFTATDAKIAKLAVSTTTISANDSTEVKINTLDAQGVLLGSYKFSDLATQKISVDIKCSNNGYKDGDKIYLKNAGDTAEIKTVLHTYQYENGVEKDTIEETFIVTAVDETYAGYTFGYSLVKTGSGEPAWDASSYKQNTATPVKEGTLAYFNFKNAAGTDKTSKFSISSADTNVLLVAGGTAQKSTGMAITGVKEGSTYLLVKDEKGSLVASLPVSVNAARKATRLELSKQSVSVSKSTQQDNVDVTLTVYDQYNEKMDIDAGSVGFTKLTVADQNANVLTTDHNTKVTVVGKNNPKGSYYYEVKAKAKDVEVKNNLSVTISEPSGSVYTYGVEFSDATVDVATDESKSAAPADKKQTIRIARYQGGVLYDYLTVASLSSISISGTNNEGSLGVASTSSLATSMTVTCGAISPAALAQVVKTGSYLVTATIKTGKDTTATVANTFSVKNDQAAKYAANVKKTDVSDKYGDIDSALADADNVFQITRDGAGVDKTKYTIKYIKQTTQGKTVNVESVDVEVTINGSNVIYLTIPVNHTFTLK